MENERKQISAEQAEKEIIQAAQSAADYDP